MKNRFESLIQGLRAAGDDVMVFTPDRHPPDDYHGARVSPPPLSVLTLEGCFIVWGAEVMCRPLLTKTYWLRSMHEQ